MTTHTAQMAIGKSITIAKTNFLRGRFGDFAKSFFEPQLLLLRVMPTNVTFEEKNLFSFLLDLSCTSFDIKMSRICMRHSVFPIPENVGNIAKELLNVNRKPLNVVKCVTRRGTRFFAFATVHATCKLCDFVVDFCLLCQRAFD